VILHSLREILRFCVCGSILFTAAAALAQTATNADPLVVVVDGKYGYIGHQGHILIPPQFIWADSFLQGFGTVYACGKYVSIDAQGNLLPRRKAAPGELAAKSKDGKVGFINPSGEFVVPPSFDDALPFSDGLAAVKTGDKWGFVDTNGRQVIPPQFKAAYYFQQGIGLVESDAGEVLIDKSGVTIAKGFSVLQPIAEGRVPASREDKSGYLDLQGKVTIPLIYDTALAFSEGLAAVEKGDKWGYVDKDGQVVVPFKFDHAESFSQGLAPARLRKTSGFIDKSGVFAFTLPYRDASGFSDDGISAFWTEDNLFGYLNTSGHVIWGPVHGIPEHTPILGWTEEDKAQSCRGFSDATKQMISGFPAE